jgi:hypothetical protein
VKGLPVAAKDAPSGAANVGLALLLFLDTVSPVFLASPASAVAAASFKPRHVAHSLSRSDGFALKNDLR